MSVLATTAGTETVPRPQAARRGRLVVAEQVIEKIAGQAASEVGSTSGRSGGLLGFGAAAEATARPKVAVDLSPDSADLSIRAGIAYPGSIRQATRELREHVTSRVEALTGVDVRRVDIEVTFLTTDLDPDQPRRVLR